MNDLQIANRALFHWGQNPITSLSDIGDGSQKRISCASNILPAINAVLTAHPWACSTSRVLLSPDATPPAFGYDYRFFLPPDILLPWQWFDSQLSPMKDGFHTEGQYLLTNEPSVGLVYSFKVPQGSIGNVREYIAEVIAFYLAWCIGPFLGFSQNDVDGKFKMYENELRKAKALNNRESPRRTFAGGTWVQAHYYADQPQLYPNIR